MCILTEYLQENSLSIDSIRKYIDDYSIYSFYIGEELEFRTSYSSPLRTSDNHPSFSLYEVYGEKYKNSRDTVIFKDHATNLKGNVFKFVQYLLSSDKDNLIPFKDVLNQINIDFDLGLSGTPKTFTPKAKILARKPIKEVAKVEIKSKPFDYLFLSYFKRYDISDYILKMYNVFNTSVIKYTYTNNTSYYYPKKLCIAYRIGKDYKFYMPFNQKGDRFKSFFPVNYVEGFLQFKYEKPFCIITKAMKESMFFRQHFDIDACAGKSENTMIPDFIMQMLFKRFKYVLIWLDRDNGGKIATDSYLSKYPNLIPVNYDNTIEDKDVTDRYYTLKQQGNEEKALFEIREILWQYLILNK